MAKLECPECGLLWDDDPEVNDASHCDCGYPIDSMFLQPPHTHHTADRDRMMDYQKRFELSQRFRNPDVNDIEYQRYCFDMQKPSHHCGLMPFICVDGVYYQMTGLRDGWCLRAVCRMENAN